MNMAMLAKSNKFITIAITMASLKPVFFFLLFSFLYIPSTTEATDPIFLRENCTTNDTFTANSAFQLNLRTLLTSLSSNATGTTEFFNTTIADKNPADTVYGLFMCRGDVPSDLCRECVINATQRLGGRSSDTCPFSKGAIIWYDECMIRYSNRNFFSTMDTMPRMRLRNTVNVTDAEKEKFMKLLYTTLNETADEAAKAPVGMKKYATKEANMSAFQTLYTLTQCTPDLTPQDCRRCLAKVIADVPWCCTYRVGGRVLYPSCNFRYEFYPFFRNSTADVPSGQVSPAAKQKGKKGTSSGTIIAIVVPITVAVLLFVVGLCFLSKRARKKYDSAREGKAVNDMSNMTNVEELQYDFHRIEEATNNFSVDNKLGEGGFGEVYKGTLPSGQVIAVKRLSKSSGQGAQEFKNEVVLVAKLEHRNLVRLLGFCVQGQEKLLIYEFVPNKSLDYVVFNPERQKELDWTRRYKIIGGIARGILYLHEESRLRIIHRDLKASNVLLDADMNPKISDFGMARLFGVDQIQGNTSRIVGTYGYMSPEYAMHGQYSVKSDVYSFGVLLMEIISGKKNSSFCQTDGAEDLLSYAWKLWKDGSPLELLDPTLRESCAPNEVVRCIHIGLLCVQEDPEDRPTMATIILMLDSYTVTLPAPKQPAFFIHSQTDPNMPKDLMYGQSTSKSITASVNEMSVSEFLPR